MAGTKTAAKNSKANSKKANVPASAADIKFIISCGGGASAYVRNAAHSLNPNLATDGPEFTAAVAALAQAGHGPKVHAELVALATSERPGAWPLVLKRLTTSGVLV